MVELLGDVVAGLSRWDDVVNTSRLGEGNLGLGEVVLEVGISLQLTTVGVAKVVTLSSLIASKTKARTAQASEAALDPLVGKVSSVSLASKVGADAIVSQILRACKADCHN